MSGLMQYQDADLKNRVSVSEATPMPVTTPPGSGLAVTDFAYDTDGVTPYPGGLPQGLTQVSYRDGSDNITSIVATDGVVTVVANAPVITGDTINFESTILRYSSGSVLSQTAWVKQ